MFSIIIIIIIISIQNLKFAIKKLRATYQDKV